MRQAKLLRAFALIVLAMAAGAVGCTHNYYYGNAVPICPEAMTTVNTIGPVCEVPAQAAGAPLLSQAGGASVIGGTPRSTRVVVSEPREGGIPIRGSGRFAWRRTDPDSSLATTHVEGALEDDTVNR
jgi:hypothetical protein